MDYIGNVNFLYGYMCHVKVRGLKIVELADDNEGFTIKFKVGGILVELDWHQEYLGDNSIYSSGMIYINGKAWMPDIEILDNEPSQLTASEFFNVMCNLLNMAGVPLPTTHFR